MWKYGAIVAAIFAILALWAADLFFVLTLMFVGRTAHAKAGIGRPR